MDGKGGFAVCLLERGRSVDVYLSGLGASGFFGHRSRKKDHHCDSGRGEGAKVGHGEQDVGPEPGCQLMVRARLTTARTERR